MAENENFIDEFYDRVESTSLIPEIGRTINEQKRKMRDQLLDVTDVVRGVTADMSPSGRFVSDVIEVGKTKTPMKSIRQKDGSYTSEEVTVRSVLVLNHKGFNSLFVSSHKNMYHYDSTYANPIGGNLMLEIIGDNDKMLALLRELVNENKKKASQRCMDLMKLGSDAIDLRDITNRIKDNIIKTDLDEPIEVNIMDISTDYAENKVTLDKVFFLIEKLSLSDNNNIGLFGRDIRGNELYRQISPSNLEDYTIFMQIITPLKNALNKIVIEMDELQEEINVVEQSINTKLASYLVLFKLDKEWKTKMGSVPWNAAPYTY